MIIDINMGWSPENLYSDKSLRNALVRLVPRAYGDYAEVATIPGSDRKQIIIEKPKGYECLNFTELASDAKDCLEVMDEAKVDKAVLQMSIWQGWLDLEMSKLLNDMMAQYIGKHPDRFLGLCMVPPLAGEEALDELDRCINDLGFSGVLCAAHYGNLYVDEEDFWPYWQKINELGVPVVVHHTHLPVEYNSIYKYANLRRFYGRCIDQMTSLGRILYSGLLDEYPNLKLIYTMLAGGFFTYANLMNPRKSVTSEEMERFAAGAEKIDEYLKRNIYFDMTHAAPWGKDQLECAIKVLGADHVLFGGGYHVRREWLLKGVEFVQSLDIDQEAKSQILGGNAVRLLNIKA